MKKICVNWSIFLEGNNITTLNFLPIFNNLKDIILSNLFILDNTPQLQFLDVISDWKYFDFFIPDKSLEFNLLHDSFSKAWQISIGVIDFDIEDNNRFCRRFSLFFLISFLLLLLPQFLLLLLFLLGFLPKQIIIIIFWFLLLGFLLLGGSSFLGLTSYFLTSSLGLASSQTFLAAAVKL